MRYYLDTEFNEGMVNPVFGAPYHRIDLISVGIASEDHRQYYAINKEFNVHDAWYKWQWKNSIQPFLPGISSVSKIREYWLRENVLWPIYWNLIEQDDPIMAASVWANRDSYFGYYEFKRLIKKYGKTKAEIGKEIFEFCKGGSFKLTNQHAFVGEDGGPKVGDIDTRTNPEFYGYYADYDWVAICGSLYGSMMKLPETFPMYCRDLKQMLDDSRLGKDHPDYPKQTNEHTADADAEWNMRLHQFINDHSLKI